MLIPRRGWATGLIGLFLLVGCTANKPTGAPESPVPSRVNAAAPQATPSPKDEPAAPSAKESRPIPTARFPEIMTRSKGRPYSASYTWSGKGRREDAALKLDGRVGWMPNGDQFLILDGGTGYMKRGTGYWYLTATAKPDGPDGLNQRPYMDHLARLPIADFAMLTALEQYNAGFVAEAEQGELTEWVSNLPPRKTSIQLLGGYREMMTLRVWTKAVGGEILPVKAEVSWWDGGQVSCEVTYQWSEPEFPALATSGRS